MGVSPRHIKPSISTHLPVAKHFVNSKVITDVPEKIKIRKQKHYFMIVTHTNCQNCVKVMPLQCDCQMRSGHWSTSLERRGPVLTWLKSMENIIVGTVNGSGQHPRSYRSQWKQPST